MFVEAELGPEPVGDLLHAVLLVLQRLLEVVRHLLTEDGVGLEGIGEDDGGSLAGWVPITVLELLPVL